MSGLDPEKQRSLARASRRAAVLTVVGALIVFGALAYSAWQMEQLSVAKAGAQQEIRMLQAQVEELAQRKDVRADELEALEVRLENLQLLQDRQERELQRLQGERERMRSELAELEQEKKRLAAEILSLQTARRVQSEQNASLQRSLQEIQKEVQSNAGGDRPTRGDLYDRVQKITPVSAFVTSRAAARPTGATEGGRRYFDFSLWIEAPPDELRRIRRVSYEFNHPTFTQREVGSANPSDGFRVAYRGWGCLYSVLITLHRSDGDTERLDFNMCRALGW